MISLTSGQEAAVKKIAAWIKDSEQPEFVLAGLAGTGKSTIIQHAIQRAGISFDDVAFCAFTGKAALVMNRKGVSAQTIHKTIYRLEEIKNGYGQKIGYKSFRLVDPGELNKKLIVVDECSMVSKKILADMRRLGIKTLFVGDHGQLPPVGEKSDVYNRLVNAPDAKLEEIMRQADGSPILQLAMMARSGQAIATGVYGHGVVVAPKARMFEPDVIKRVLLAADQVICGKNDTRKFMAQKMRGAIGIKSPDVVEGDKVVCRSNNYGNLSLDGSTPLVNGLIGFVDSAKTVNGNYQAVVRADYSQDVVFETVIHGEWFKNGKPKVDMTKAFKAPVSNSMDHFEFGYAITCHTSQGSEWRNVVVVNEILNKEDHHRWLYTAITRASQRLVLFT